MVLKEWSQLLTRIFGEGAKNSKGAHLSFSGQKKAEEERGNGWMGGEGLLHWLVVRRTPFVVQYRRRQFQLLVFPVSVFVNLNHNASISPRSVFFAISRATAAACTEVL